MRGAPAPARGFFAPTRRGAYSRLKGAGTVFRATGAGRRRLCRRECTPHCRRRKVRLTPFPPDGENCARSLAPPLPTGTAPLGSCGGPVWRPKKRTGRARSKRKNARDEMASVEVRQVSARGVVRAGVWIVRTPPAPLSAAAPWERRGSVSGAWRAGFPTTTNVDRRGGHAGNADSREGLCPRRGAGRGFGGLGHLLRRFPLALPGSAGVASAGLGGRAFLRPPTLTAAVETRGKPIQGRGPGARRQETGELVAVR